MARRKGARRRNFSSKLKKTAKKGFGKGKKFVKKNKAGFGKISDKAISDLLSGNVSAQDVALQALKNTGKLAAGFDPVAGKSTSKILQGLANKALMG